MLSTIDAPSVINTGWQDRNKDHVSFLALAQVAKRLFVQNAINDTSSRNILAKY